MVIGFLNLVSVDAKERSKILILWKKYFNIFTIFWCAPGCFYYFLTFNAIPVENLKKLVKSMQFFPFLGLRPGGSERSPPHRWQAVKRNFSLPRPKVLNLTDPSQNYLGKTQEHLCQPIAQYEVENYCQPQPQIHRRDHCQPQVLNGKFVAHF